MKIRDIFIFSIKGIKANLMKFIFAVLELTVISTILIMVNNGTSYYINNSKQLVKDYCLENNEVLRYTREVDHPISFSNILEISKISHEYDSYINYVSYSGQSGDTVIDYSYINDLEFTLLDGEITEKKNGIYISNSYKEDYESINYNQIEVGSYIDIDLINYIQDDFSSITTKLEVLGIYSDQRNLSNFIINIDDVLSIDSNYTFLQCKVVFKLDENNFFSNANKVEELYDKICDVFYGPEKDKFESCDVGILDLIINMKINNNRVNVIRWIISICFSLLATIVVLFTILLIFIENSYSMNIYKTLGMKKRSFITVYIFEMLLIMLISLILSFILSNGLNYIPKNMSKSFLERRYRNYILYLNYNFKFHYNYYYFSLVNVIFVMFVIIGMWLLLTFKSKNSINLKEEGQ